MRGKPAVLKAGRSYGLTASRPHALRAWAASGGQRFRRWTTTGNVPARSYATSISRARPRKLPAVTYWVTSPYNGPSQS